MLVFDWIFVISFRNINSNVMTTIRLIFRVSQIQGYSQSFIQDVLRTGLKALLNGKNIVVPEYGEISGIVLLGMPFFSKKKRKEKERFKSINRKV